MTFFALNQLPQTKGKLIWIYSIEGVGKTTSSLQSLPLPIAYIGLEGRDVRGSIEAANRPELLEEGNLKITYYDTWENLLELINNLDNFNDVTSVLFDGISQLMNIELSIEIEDEAYYALEGSKESKDIARLKKPIAGRTRMEFTEWGALSSSMFRLLMSLRRIMTTGKIVVITSLLWEGPRWNKTLAAGPALKGKEFPCGISGPVDLIGMTESRTKNGIRIFPPKVSFESLDGNYIAKWSGIRPKNKRGEELNPVVMPLDFRKILRLNENE